MLKKTLALLIIVTLLLNICTIEAQAALPAVIYGAAEAGIICDVAAGLIAAGLVFSVKECAEHAAQWFWDTTTQAVKDQIITSHNEAVNNVVEIQDETWTSYRDHVQTNYQNVADGYTYRDKTITAPSPFVESGIAYEIEDIDGAFPYYSQGGMLIPGKWIVFKDIAHNKYIENMWMREGDYIAVYIRSYLDGQTPGTWTKCSQAGYIETEVTNDDQIRWMVYSEDGIDHVGVKLRLPTGTKVSASQLYIYGQARVYICSAVNYSGTEALDSPTWDFENSQGKREVAVPPVLNDLLDKDYNEIATEGAVFEDGTAGVAPSATTSSIVNAINNFFDLDTPINWDPLIVSGALFTNKFPFSLPWDLLHSFNVWQTPEEEVVFNISVPDTQYLKGMAFNINFDWFKGFIPIIKTIELILFDIALILATRRLLGGAS